MMGRVLINAVASTAGGGQTWLWNVLPRLGRLSPAGIDWLVIVPPGEIEKYRHYAGPQIAIEAAAPGGGLIGRWWWEQRGLRRLVAERSIETLVAAGNFAMWNAPVPQILFNRSDLNFSVEFRRDLWRRREWGMLAGQVVKSILARRSIREATINVVPTQAFGERIRQAISPRPFDFTVLPFGFDADLFRAEQTLTVEAIDRQREDRGPWRLLYVSHYNYFRNFETLLRALPRLSELVRERTGRSVELVLTTEIARGRIQGGYDASAAAGLIESLGIGSQLRMLGAIPYGQLHHLYESADLFVCPSDAESFGHPLLEAMACGLPVIIADHPVHREVCGGAAAVFATFDPEELANRAAELLADAPRRAAMSAAGRRRVREFSWDDHVRGLIRLVEMVESLRAKDHRH